VDLFPAERVRAARAPGGMCPKGGVVGLMNQARRLIPPTTTSSLRAALPSKQEEGTKMVANDKPNRNANGQFPC